MYNGSWENDDWEYDPDDPEASRKPWNCARCGIDNRPSRTDCRMCMCPRDNACSKCKKINEPKARYCRFCGALTEFSRYRVFDPEVRKREARSSRAEDRRYRKVGHYYQWEDGPYQAIEEFL